MAITKLNPFTIHLGGSLVVLDDREFPASAAITPGMLVEMFDDAGDPKYRPHSADTRQVSLSVALSRDEFNNTIDDPYAIGETVKVGFMSAGTTFYGILPSGQDIAKGDLLQSNGDGKLKIATAETAAANVARFQSLGAPGAVVVDTRIRVQVIS